MKSHTLVLSFLGIVGVAGIASLAVSIAPPLTPATSSTESTDCVNPTLNASINGALAAHTGTHQSSPVDYRELERAEARLVGLNEAALTRLTSDRRWESPEQRVGLAAAIAYTQQELDTHRAKLAEARQALVATR